MAVNQTAPAECAVAAATCSGPALRTLAFVNRSQTR